MSCDIEPVLPEGPVYRLARGPDPWAWVDWVYAGPDGSFGGRFDDPHGEYRVLYAASTRLGAFMETLALSARTRRCASPSRRATPQRRTACRASGSSCAGSARRGSPSCPSPTRGTRARWRSCERLMDAIVEHELDDLDAAAIRLSAPRRFTQLVGRVAFDCADADGDLQFAGLR
jgi:hypothetical protein